MNEQIQHSLSDGRTVTAETQNLFDYFLNDLENLREQLEDLGGNMESTMIGDVKKLQELTEQHQRISIVRMSGDDLAKEGIKHWAALDVIVEETGVQPGKGEASASIPSSTMRIRQAIDSLDELEWYLDGKVPRDSAEERRLLRQAIRRIESHMVEIERGRKALSHE